jgi:L-threonylcarbamoyladenylate synthase
MGLLVAFPTETVYGLGADARDRPAVRAVFAAKRRPVDHPLIVHLAGEQLVDRWARDVPEVARRLARACWPGPLTMLLRRADGVLDEVTGRLDTIGLRVPRHPLALALLEEFGDGVAAPSANTFGAVSPTTAAHVVADLGDRVDLVLDGGPCEVGVESTIVDLSSDRVQILRPGGVPRKLIAGIVGELAEVIGPSRAPGMLESHYAPAARVLLAADAKAATSIARSIEAPWRIIGSDVEADVYAHHLYEWLRRADADGVEVVVAVLPPDDAALGTAVRDRLGKAAARQNSPS